jgi:hypothetical protein
MADMTDEERRAAWEAQNAKNWAVKTPHQIVLNFQHKNDRDEFLGWMSDGGGEYQFKELLRENYRRSVSFLYHPPETEAVEEPKQVKVIRVK